MPIDPDGSFYLMRTVENFLGRDVGAGKIVVREVSGQFLKYLILCHRVMLEMEVLVLTALIQAAWAVIAAISWRACAFF